MLNSYRLGQTGIVVRVILRDSTSSSAAGLTGLTFSSTGLTISAIADNESSTTSYAAGSSTIETISTLGTFATPTTTKCRFKEVDSAKHPGLYEIQLDNTRFSVTNAKSLVITILGATNLAKTDVLIPLTSVDPYDAVRGGLTAIPNTAVSTNGSLITGGTGTDQLTLSAGKVALQASQVIGSVTGSVGSVAGSVGSISGVTFPTNFSSFSIDSTLSWQCKSLFSISITRLGLANVLARDILLAKLSCTTCRRFSSTCTLPL
jgi:hypothetical protein